MPRPAARRALAVLGAVTLATPVLPLPAAAAPVIVLRDVREFACPPGQVRPPGTAPRFTDTAGNTFELEIACLAGYEVTRGVGDGTAYDPAGTVTRVQMAQFVARVAARASVPLDTRDAGFTDIANQSPDARDAINALANAGVVRGRTATTYEPAAPVRRDQMASFLARLQERVGAPFPAGENYFTDDDGTEHEASINRIAAAGVVQGVSEGTYGFSRNITRQQMAGFLTRYLDGQVAAGEIPGRYPRDNRVLPVSPAETAALAVGQQREFTATSLLPEVEYRVTLVQTSTVSPGPDGVLRFTDADGDRLAEVGSYAARIVTINGREVPPAADGAPSTGVTRPADGRVTVVVRGNAESDDVIPVFYPNTGRSPRLELAGDLRPVEVYGVGGSTRFGPPPAGPGQTGSGVVTSQDRTRSSVTIDVDGDGTGDRSYDYGTGNAYAVEGTAQPRDTFVAALTRGDTLEVSRYQPGTAGGSAFDITADTPDAPAVSAASGEGPGAGNVTVTIAPSTPAAVTTYDRFVLERAPVNGLLCQGTVGTFEQIADEPSSRDADGQRAGFQYVDQPGEGCFRYRAAGVVDGQQSPFGTSGNVESAPPSPADTRAPRSESAAVTRDAGAAGTADGGDQITVAFDEDLRPAPADAFVQVRRADGELATIRNSGGPVPPFRVSGRTLTLELPVGVTIGPYPLVVTEAGRITDIAGNLWDVANSPDRVIDR